MFCLIACIHRWRLYLDGPHFKVFANHRDVTYLLRIKYPSARLSRGAFKLSEHIHTNTDCDRDSTLEVQSKDPIYKKRYNNVKIIKLKNTLLTPMISVKNSEKLKLIKPK